MEWADAKVEQHDEHHGQGPQTINVGPVFGKNA
jgi:hypothetical protein